MTDRKPLQFDYFPFMHLFVEHANYRETALVLTYREWIWICKKYLGVGEMNQLHGRLLDACAFATSVLSLWSFYFLQDTFPSSILFTTATEISELSV